ncbi:MAG: uroporphyrinogen-III C-methyltransferase [Hyphomicrobiales bacterium]|jgi:uroporphyrin-III C-methyltransferase|nr:uroporphyrinogen-III C-methyltransferase [Hyphomicrobiales bacterium]|tara:strand:+ start:2771 stop:3565 length:795 start_codon:yes stop_codon:yes gene_type:complete
MQIFDKLNLPEFKEGEVWLVGAGPGDPRLLTVFAIYALSKANVVIYDALVSDEILALTDTDAILVYAGKRGGKPSHSQKNISELVIKYAKEGYKVLRLKGGDPFIFARGAEESFTLNENKISYRVIPGITSSIGGMAAASIPATSRNTNSSILFLTGHNSNGEIPDDIDWSAVSRIPVVIMYMAVKHLPVIIKKLISEGRKENEPIAIIQDATLITQKVLESNLGNINNDIQVNNIRAPSIVVLGPVVDLRSKLIENVIKDAIT